MRNSCKKIAALLLALAVITSGLILPEKAHAEYADDGYSFLLDSAGDTIVKLPNLISSGAGVAGVTLTNGWHIAATEGNLYSFVVTNNGSYSGQIGYCLAPGTPVPNANAYKVKSASYVAEVAAQNTLLTESQLSYLMSLVLGYGYNGKYDKDYQNDKNYYDMFGKIWATQVLVWECVVGERGPSFNHVQPAGTGVCKDCIKSTNPIYSYFTAHYAAIEAEVQKVFKNPSFTTETETKAAANTHKLAYSNGQYTLILTDANTVLSNYTAVSSDANVSVTVNGNTITLTSAKPISSDVKITLTRNIEHKSFVIAGKNGQDFATVKKNGSGVWQSIMIPIAGSATKKAYFYLEKSEGEVKLSKVSANPSCTSGNPNYSLAGAVYGVYTEGNTANNTVNTASLVGKITTDANGKGSIVAGLTAGRTYYVKEITPSKGYKLDPKVYAVTPDGTGDKAAAVTSTEAPVNDPLTIQITKESAETITNPASLAGTQFTVKYYAVDPAVSYTAAQLAAMTATRTWVFEAKAETVNGKTKYVVRLNENYLVSGSDPLYFNNGIATLPIGYFTIQETKAAPGYIKDSGTIKVGGTTVSNNGQAIVGWVDANGDIHPDSLKVSNEYTATNAPVYGGFELAKYDAATGKPAAGTVSFDLYNTSSYSIMVGGTEVKAGEKVGSYSFDASSIYQSGQILPYGSYKIAETKAPKGYLLKGRTEITFSITENNQVVDLTAAGTALSDTPNTGRVIVTKDAEDSVISGIEFNLSGTSDEGDSVNFTKATGTDGKAVFENVPAGTYSVKEVNAAYRYKTVASQNVTVTAGQTANLSFTNRLKKGVIELQKTGEIFASVKEEDGKYAAVFEEGFLANAVFEIRAAEDIVLADGTVTFKKGAVVDTVTTSKNGKAQSKSLDFGKYEIEEVQAPASYVRDTNIYQVELVSTDSEVTIESKSISNTRQKIDLSILKSMEEDETFKLGVNGELAKVKFALYAAEEITAADGSMIPKGGLLEEISVSEDGTARFAADIPVGSYYVKEAATDEHYILTEDIFEFTFAPEDPSLETIAIVLNDKQPVENKLIRGSIEGMKKDDLGNLLAGAVFGLFKEGEEEPILTAETGEEGRFVFENVPYGNYTVKELKAPEGCLLSEEEYEAVIDENEKRIEIEAVNTIIRGSIEGLKKGEDGRLLAGAVFGLFKDGEQIAEAVSGEDGRFVFENIPYGSYIVKELKAPEGYVKTEEEFPAEIKEDGGVIEIEAENKQVRGNIEGLKKGEDGKALAGARFGLFDGETQVAEAVSGEDGSFLFQAIPYGKYIVKELEAPEGFVLSEKEYNVTVKEDGEVIEIEAVNFFIRGDIKLIKVDAEDTGVKLSGAVFEVYEDKDRDGVLGEEDVLFGTMTEEAEGEYYYRNLPYGTYLVKEVCPPKHFAADENIYIAIIDENGETEVIANRDGLFADAHAYGRVEFFPPVVNVSFTGAGWVSPVTGENMKMHILFAASAFGVWAAFLFGRKKRLQKILAFALIFCITAGFAAPAFAAEEELQTVVVTVESYEKEDPQAIQAALEKQGLQDIEIRSIRYEVVEESVGVSRTALIRGLKSKEDARQYLTDENGLTADFGEIEFTEKYRAPAEGYYDTAVGEEVPAARSLRISQNGATADVRLDLISSEDMVREEIRDAEFSAKFYEDYSEYVFGDTYIDIDAASPCFDGYQELILAALGLDPAVYTITGGHWGETTDAYRSAVYTGTQKVEIPFVRSYYAEDPDNPDRLQPVAYDAKIKYGNGTEEGKTKYTLRGTVTYIHHPGMAAAAANRENGGFLQGRRLVILAVILALLGIFFTLGKKKEKKNASF